MKSPLILPARYRKQNSLSVKWETFLCDAAGRIERPLQSGRNMITDWGMDNLQATTIMTLIDYLHLGDTTQTLKRLAGSSSATLTLDDTNPASIAVTSDVNFFEAGDVNRTLKVDGVPEMLVTGYTNAQAVTAKARGSVWLPSYTPTGVIVSGAAGIHYTNTPSLATEFTRFNTKDTGTVVNDLEVTDSANSRFNCTKVFLSGVVSGSAWTVNQLGWGTNTTNCFGKANLGSPDTVAVGKRYRVELTVYFGFTPINLSAVTVNWGGTVGSYTCDIRQERIGKPGDIGSSSNPDPGGRYNFLRPTTVGTINAGWWTSAFTMDTTKWHDDGSFTNLNSRAGQNLQTSSGALIDAAYTSGNFNFNRTARWFETSTITAATGLFIGTKNTAANILQPCLTVRPTSGTITKSNGYRVEIIFPIYWSRQLVN